MGEFPHSLSEGHLISIRRPSIHPTHPLMRPCAHLAWNPFCNTLKSSSLSGNTTLLPHKISLHWQISSLLQTQRIHWFHKHLSNQCSLPLPRGEVQLPLSLQDWWLYPIHWYGCLTELYSSVAWDRASKEAYQMLFLTFGSFIEIFLHDLDLWHDYLKQYSCESTLVSWEN